MQLKDVKRILESENVLKEFQGCLDIEIQGVSYDFKRVKNNFLYVAIEVYTQLDKQEVPEGHDYINEAISAGAVAIVVREKVTNIPQSITQIVCKNTREALAIICREFYNGNEINIKTIGITGTNGKTTTSNLVSAVLSQDNAIGLMGTLCTKIAGEVIESKDTTPEPVELFERFQIMKDKNCSHCVMEVSSHGLDYHRVRGLNFSVAAFTNLTPDHLDYHKTMENYLQAKLKLFKSLNHNSHAVINLEDPYAEHFIKASNCNVLTYGKNGDLRASEVLLEKEVTRFLLTSPSGKIEVNLPLVGKFNIMNALAAAGICHVLGLSLKKIKSGLESIDGVPGRMDLVDYKNGPRVYIDYAHSPDGVKSVLELVQELPFNKVISVSGCGGSRDSSKRPLMGRAASELSDIAIFTSDNPRKEDPKKIITQMSEGVSTNNNCEIISITERAEAIDHAISIANEDDVVVILGKGHEKTQIFADYTISFDDKLEAEKALKKYFKA